MKKIENTALQMIAEASRCPDYGPDMVKSLMKKLDMNEKGFALLMNVAPSTVRLWTSGAAQPCGTAKRLMQIYETGPEIGRQDCRRAATGRWEGLIKWRGQIASRLRKMSRSKSCFT